MQAPLQNIKAPSPLLLVTELVRGAINFGTYFASLPLSPFLPKGDGHIVMVLPGFLTNDSVTVPLRYFLKSNGYTPKPWELGRNYANYEEIEEKMLNMIKRYAEESGQKISLIGWSAGGIFARALANEVPECVRQVITLGSPFRGVVGKNNLQFLTEVITGKKNEDIENVILERSAGALKVSNTSIYTRLDGIVAWQACLNEIEDHTSENVEVFASHIGLGFDPMTLVCIADRLAQPEDEWRPFKTTTVGKMFYSYPWNK
ncbi:MAG: alpha/beta hydrolase [Bacteroidetes bacterium]|nr:MAG: alpha/beta hydrolase [Bacteroidota bacterium]TAG93772.1 MAG: alpha/beta hydrolase [Bacteroidota bacterium]